MRHVPSAHVVVPAVEVHDRPQLPQSLSVRIERSQPVSWSVSQFEYPVSHDEMAQVRVTVQSAIA